MALQFLITTSVTVALLILVANCILVVHSYIQEAQLHQSTDLLRSTYLRLHGEERDISRCYVGNTLTMICTKGVWIGYSEQDFEGVDTLLHGMNSNLACKNVAGVEIRSIRSGGNVNTTTRGIHFFSRVGFQGVTHQIHYGQLHGLLNGKSFVITGNDDWTLYEEQNFSDLGRVVCVPVPDAFHQLELFPVRDVIVAYNIPHVGSVHAGCSAEDRAKAKALYESSLNAKVNSE